MKMKFVAAMVWVLAVPCLLMASEYTVFQQDIVVPYGLYKKSLALTSKVENRDKAVDMVEKFIASWETLAQKYEADVPERLQQTQDFAGKIKRPVAVGREALAMLRDGEVIDAHRQLEEVRYLLWQIRVDAGIVSLNDKINDFHEAMEVVLDGITENASADSLRHLEQRYGAWLAIKWADIKGSDFSGSDKDGFAQGMINGQTAIADLREKLRAGDAAGAGKAGAMVKKSYKYFFFLPECS